MNFGALAASALSDDPEAVKTSLSLAAVVASFGVELLPDGEGRLIGLCPLHDDQSPSFAVWAHEGLQWAGCWGCDFGVGDVFAFLMAVHACSFTDAVRLAIALRDGGDLPDVPDISPNGEDPPKDFLPLYRLAYRETDMGLIERFLSERGVDVPASWVVDEFDVCSIDVDVLIPHRTTTGVIVAIRKRIAPDWEKKCLAGSRLSQLYGIQRAMHPVVVDGRRRRMADTRDAILVEGESDCWSVSYWLRDECLDVVGLPAGAGSGIQPAWLQFLAGRRVTILFDADPAGRSGAERWAAALAGVAGSVAVAHLPDGLDATSAGPVIVRNALEGAS